MTDHLLEEAMNTALESAAKIAIFVRAANNYGYQAEILANAISDIFRLLIDSG